MFAFTPQARVALRATAFAAGLALAAPAVATADPFDLTALVSDLAGAAATLDADLINPWGIAFNPNGTAWVANNRSGKATLYDGNGVKQGLVVTIPANGAGQGTPTGVVFNGTPDFKFATTPGATPVAASFLFVSMDGLVSAWAPGITTAVPVAMQPGSIYTGVALSGNGTVNRLYAADFFGGKIDVYSNAFAPTSVPGGFVDASIPEGYGPFNVTAIQGNLYVASAKIGDRGVDRGAGRGFVRVFDTDGFLVDRGLSRGHLNAPWGIALAPAGFGRFSNRLLVGNFGDGVINAYDAASGGFVGSLRTGAGKPERIDGVWAIAFGNGVRGQHTDALFFAAGVADETHGVYGRIDADED
ncbi:MAG TPA: TIGR03118 family protein [Casimicrobiaceae bacterium]|nr:TIGR03118 family protein [Casimicrobiaceae bacterium]